MEKTNFEIATTPIYNFDVFPVDYMVYPPYYKGPVQNHTIIIGNLKTREIVSFKHFLDGYINDNYTARLNRQKIPGVYAIYLLDAAGIEYQDIGDEVFASATLDNYPFSQFGKVVEKAIYLVRPNTTIDLNKFAFMSRLPGDMKREILSNGIFSVYEILYLCQREKVIEEKICSVPAFWQKYASNILSRRVDFSTYSKDQLLRILKLADFAKQLRSDIDMETLNQLLDYGIWMREFIAENYSELYDYPDRFARKLNYQNRLLLFLSYFSQEFLYQYGTEVLPSLRFGIEAYTTDLPGGTDEAYQYLSHRVIEAMTDETFGGVLTYLVDHAREYYRPTLEVMLEYLEEGEREECRQRFDQHIIG